MDRKIANKIITQFQESELLIADSFLIEKSLLDKTLTYFHPWAENYENLGAFLLRQKDSKTAYWLVFNEWNPKYDFYLIVYPENRAGTLIEIHRIKNNNFIWEYSPAKRDGRNSERKAYFEKYFHSTNVEISIPEKEDEVVEFIHEIFLLVENRLKADNLDFDPPIERIGFPEGKRLERKHYARERNSRLIQIVKEKSKKENGKLVCQICKFDFEKNYGIRGKDYIEAHHTRPLSELDIEGIDTKMDEIALVCANCHKMIHRFRPWLKMEQLRIIIKN